MNVSTSLGCLADYSIHIERVYMNCLAIECARPFGMGLTSAEGHKLKCLNKHCIILYKKQEHLVNPLCSIIKPVSDLTQALYVYTTISTVLLDSLPNGHY